jgi:hypothetical protein
MNRIRAGESCSLIGVASIGKSNLLRFLMQPDVRQHYLGQDWEQYLFVLIDRNKLAKVSDWGVLELFLHEIVGSLEKAENAERWAPLIERFDKHYSEVVGSRDRLLAQRYLSRWLGAIANSADLRFAFLLDDFDDVMEQLDQALFLNLRALRDDNRYRVSYLFFTRRLLTHLREDMETTLESFYELFSHCVHPLTPYKPADAREMVNRLMARNQIPLSEPIIAHLLKVSGGHSGLLRAAFEIVQGLSPDQARSALRRSSENYGIEVECEKIWNSLTEGEREVLLRAARFRQQAESEDVFARHLRFKGLLVTSENGESELFSPAFAGWLQRKVPG